MGDLGGHRPSPQTRDVHFQSKNTNTGNSRYMIHGTGEAPRPQPCCQGTPKRLQERGHPWRSHTPNPPTGLPTGGRAFKASAGQSGLKFWSHDPSFTGMGFSWDHPWGPPPRLLTGSCGSPQPGPGWRVAGRLLDGAPNLRPLLGLGLDGAPLPFTDGRPAGHTGWAWVLLPPLTQSLRPNPRSGSRTGLSSAQHLRGCSSVRL